MLTWLVLLLKTLLLFITPGATGDAVPFNADDAVLRKFDMPKAPIPINNDPAPISFRKFRLDIGVSFKLSSSLDNIYNILSEILKLLMHTNRNIHFDYSESSRVSSSNG
jgi:hypothetical protein